MVKNIPEISSGVFYVGFKDKSKKLFDALIPLPEGTSYNSYLVKGNAKTAVIDTVYKEFKQDLLDKINKISNNVDYIIMNHAEPDHASSIPFILEKFPKAKLVTSDKGMEMVKVYYNVADERIIAVKDNDTIDLGGKTLKFIYAPWVHWPETMFTFLVEDKILFSCDFFGSHTALGVYDDEVENLILSAKKYYGEIMMPFAKLARKAFEKAKELNPKIIAPSHGPVYKKPGRIMPAYDEWTARETKEKAIVVYASMWGATENIVNRIGEELKSNGIEISIYNLENADLGDIAADLVDSSGIVLGAPCVLGGMHPLAVYAADIIKKLKPPLKFAVILSSYAWGGGAVSQATGTLSNTNIEIVGTLEIKGPAGDEDFKSIMSLGKKLADSIKS